MFREGRFNFSDVCRIDPASLSSGLSSACHCVWRIWFWNISMRWHRRVWWISLFRKSWNISELRRFLFLRGEFENGARITVVEFAVWVWSVASVYRICIYLCLVQTLKQNSAPFGVYQMEDRWRPVCDRIMLLCGSSAVLWFSLSLL